MEKYMDYKNVSFIEYQKKRKEMLDDLGRLGGVCDGVKCERCPLSFSNNGAMVDCNEFQVLYPKKAIDIVMNYDLQVDWSKIPVDTKIMVRDDKKDDWNRRYFSKYEDGIVFAFDNGKTSFSVDNSNEISKWNYVKLYKEPDNK